jgi:CubicO group peptidase (beta-lactamase class C family)
VKAALVVCAVVCATTAGAAPSPQLDRFLTAAAARLDLNGAVLVAKDGEIVLRKGYGWADAARRAPNRPSTRYRISSLTSRFSQIALMQLERRGAVAGTASVCTYIPRCPAAWRPMTVDLVLAGRSGLPLFPPRPATRTLDGWIEWLRASPLRFAPGRGRDRSESRLLVEAYLVERVSKQTWIDYVDRNILRPARMVDTVLDRPGLPRRATPYVRTKQRKLEAPASFLPIVRPDVLYGLVSTVDDMYRLERALEDGTLLGEPVDERWLELGHGPRGTSDGWYAAFTHYPEDHLTVLAFNNMGGFFLGDLETRIFLLAVGWPPPRVRLEPGVLDRYAGRYTWFDGYRNRRVTVTLSRGPDGTLSFSSDRFAGVVVNGHRRGVWTMTLEPAGETTFFDARSAFLVTFQGDDTFVLRARQSAAGDRYVRSA